MSECLWIIPSRGRPENVARLQRALDKKATCSDWVFVIDADDPLRDDYLAEVVAPRAHFTLVEAGLRMGPIVNRTWEAMGRASFYAAVGFMGDDHLPRTPGFDAKLLDCLVPGGPVGTVSNLDRYGVAWGDDKLVGDAFPTAGLLGAAMLDAMGYMVPPGFQHLMIDLAWSDLAGAIGQRWYRPDVTIEHLHPAAGKAKLDAGYTDVNSAEMVDADTAALIEWRTGLGATDLPATVLRIAEAMT